MRERVRAELTELDEAPLRLSNAAPELGFRLDHAAALSNAPIRQTDLRLDPLPQS
jgi:hypothetical protein